MYEVITQSLSAVVDFTPEELFLFMQRLKPMSLKRYAFSLKEGQICKSMVIVYKGGLRYFSRTEKGEYTLGFAFEGDWIGDYESFLLQTPSAHFIEAVEDTEVFTLSYADMQALYTQSQRFEKFGRIIAENLFIEAAKSKRNLMIQSAEDRYMELLTTQPKIFERLPQHLIASYLGIQPQSLSRIRARISNTKLT
ncbi:Crp/Fnr family transcriptional regulator [Mucilaginibacter sp. ZT4R22]|uniref:Crp/Fnr family transcriptional regulator n=1 Tax=Mucilaginibacter pankratovii TaxID=2772110 RepID=A0ABR7WPV9_9SPHI|nr:Crp/Fnr family transcriptional regulator [Mucilaginibacter pankratovii]MBD1364332.1 Crp/Fnr family transcriptional regulator [Mucilaginibacter pankratovii]